MFLSKVVCVMFAYTSVKGIPYQQTKLNVFILYLY